MCDRDWAGLLDLLANSLGDGSAAVDGANSPDFVSRRQDRRGWRLGWMARLDLLVSILSDGGTPADGAIVTDLMPRRTILSDQGWTVASQRQQLQCCNGGNR